MASLLDALASLLNGQGGGVLAGLPDSWSAQYQNPNRTPDANGTAHLFATQGLAAPPLGGILGGPSGNYSPFGLGGLNLPPPPPPLQGAPASGPFPAVPYTPPQALQQPQTVPSLPPAQNIPPAPQVNAAMTGVDPVNMMPIGGYLMPQFGAAADYTPTTTPATAQPTQGQMPQPAASVGQAAAEPPGFLDRLNTGIQSMANGGSLIGALIGHLTDPQSIARAQQAQVQNVTARALLSKGVPAEDVAAAVQNPDLLKALVNQYYGKDKWKLQKTGTDGLGAETYSWVNETNGTSKPFVAGGRSPNDDGTLPANAQLTQGVLDAQGSLPPDGTPALGDPSLKGEAYLASMPKENASIVKQMVEGKIPPPSSFALGNPRTGQYWRGMIAAAQNYDPDFDATKWASRHKLATEMGASAPNSMGGILSNGKSAFEHLKIYSGKLADVGNYNGPDIPGGAAIADVGNFVGNRLIPRADTRDKIAGANAAGLKYGEESTKFYTGTGGSAAERQAALANNDARSTTAAAQAGFLQTEKELMLGRLREKEAQIRDTMGEGYLKQHPVFTPQLQATLDAIDENIAKLRGQVPATDAAATYKDGQIAVNPTTGETLVRRDGKWQPQ